MIKDWKIGRECREDMEGVSVGVRVEWSGGEWRGVKGRGVV